MAEMDGRPLIPGEHRPDADVIDAKSVQPGWHLRRWMPL
jgi:hypothetical protein